MGGGKKIKRVGGRKIKRGGVVRKIKRVGRRKIKREWGGGEGSRTSYKNVLLNYLTNRPYEV